MQPASAAQQVQRMSIECFENPRCVWKYIIVIYLFIQEAPPRVAAPVGSECAASSQEGNIISGR